MKKITSVVLLSLCFFLFSQVAQAQASGIPDNGWFPLQVRFTPDDQQLLVNACQEAHPEYCQLMLYDLQSRTWSLLPGQDSKRTYQRPSFSPDGKHLIVSSHECKPAYCNYIDARLTILDADGGNPRELPLESQFKGTDPNRDPGVIARLRPSFSPDGKRLIYYRMVIWQLASRGMFLPRYMLWELDLDTMEEKRLLPDSVFERIFSSPKYLPDGDRFLYSAWPSIGVQRAHMIFMNARDDKKLSYFFVPKDDRYHWSAIFDVSVDGHSVIYSAGSLGTLRYSKLSDIEATKKTVFMLLNGAGLILDSAFSNNGDRVALIRQEANQFRNTSPGKKTLWIITPLTANGNQQLIALNWQQSQ